VTGIRAAAKRWATRLGSIGLGSTAVSEVTVEG
jgi:hypothetical protein